MTDLIAIGSGLEAKKFAARKGCPLYYTENLRPYPFEWDEGTLIDLYGPSVQKIIVWEFLTTLLSLEGLLPLSSVNSVLKLDDGLLEISTEGSMQDSISFERAVVFEPHHISQSTVFEDIQLEYYEVIDWFDIPGQDPDYDSIHFPDRDFVRDLYFYDKERIARSRGIKGLLSQSELSSDELEHPEYTPTFAKFLIEDLTGIEGEYNGRDCNPVYSFSLLEDSSSLMRLKGCSLPTLASVSDSLKKTMYYLIETDAFPYEEIT